MMRFLSVIAIFLARGIFCFPLAGQVSPAWLEDRIHRDNIHTVILSPADRELGYPVMELGSSDRLTLKFDELTDQPGNYTYTFIHCDAYWQPSGLSPYEFLDGFTEDQIQDYRFSFNTTVDYIHYSLTFPNEQIDFRLSGNYILLVYQDYDQSKPVLTRRFSVYENLVQISPEIKPPVLTELNRSGQEIDVQVSLGSYPMRDPMDELHLVIRQNGRWDNAVMGLKPLFIRGSNLSYDHNNENVFPGINEFRYFDIRSFRYQSEFVRNIDYRAPWYYVELAPCRERAGKGYFSDPEINGKFRIEVQEGHHPHTDADYARVFFSYPAAFPFRNTDLFIMGDLTDWQLSKRSIMVYNESRHQYELTLLLKQGYYNYWLATRASGESSADPSPIEGTYYETENDYLIYLYHRPSGSRYDRLIGYTLANSQGPGRNFR
ncbi:MAG TPA: DUF5103 domain-containing protein [Bacteroidetes bacterium]|nr:DUF5103 domain-containing protein [Bacteroidota bacterium]